MATATPNPFQIDLDARKRTEDIQNAQFIANQMQARMATEMQMRGYLVKPVRDANGVWTGDFEPDIDPSTGQPRPTQNAASDSRQQALAEYTFEFNKSQSGLDYAMKSKQFEEQQRQFNAQNQLAQQQFGLNQQQAKDQGNLGMLNYDLAAKQAQVQKDMGLANLTGYVGGQNTLARDQFLAQQSQANAGLSGYMDTGQNTLSRDQYLANKAQQDASVTGYMNGQNTLSRDQYLANKAQQDANITGYMNGQDTLARQTQTAGLTGYLNGQNTLARDQFGEGQRQFNVNTVMNAPTAPVDIPAYLNRLRGVNQSGMVPGIIGNFLGGQQVAAASSGGVNTPPPISRTQMGLELTGQSQGTQRQAMGGGDSPYGGPAYDQSPGNSAGMDRFLEPTQQQGDPTIAASRTWSPTGWEKLNPTEQQYTLGLNQEYNGEPVGDAQSNIAKSGAHYRQGRMGSFSGIG